MKISYSSFLCQIERINRSFWLSDSTQLLGFVLPYFHKILLITASPVKFHAKESLAQPFPNRVQELLYIPQENLLKRIQDYEARKTYYSIFRFSHLFNIAEFDYSAAVRRWLPETIHLQCIKSKKRKHDRPETCWKSEVRCENQIFSHLTFSLSFALKFKFCLESNCFAGVLKNKF